MQKIGNVTFISRAFLTIAFTFPTFSALGFSLTCPYGCNNPATNEDLREIKKYFSWAIDKSLLGLAWDKFQDENGNVSSLTVRWSYTGLSKDLLSRGCDFEHVRKDSLRRYNTHQYFNATNYIDMWAATQELEFDINWYYGSEITHNEQIIKNDIEEIKKIYEDETYGKEFFSKHLNPDLEDKCRTYSYWIPRLKSMRSNSLDVLQVLSERNDQLFKKIYDQCIILHQSPAALYQRGLISFNNADYIEAFDDISKLITISQTQGEGDLSPEIYTQYGIIASELGLYQTAINSLSAAIRINPENKDAYLERAVAYFEIGQFDKALEDYLKAGLQNSSSISKLQFIEITSLSAGISIGIIEGTKTGLVEFIPGVLGSLRGLSNGLWAFCNDPVGASQDFADAAIQCIEYLKSYSTTEILQEIVPELKELIQNYDALNDYQKGKMIGIIVGKYGIDIFLTRGALTGIKRYRDLKKANQLLTLEALASPKNAQIILEEASKRWALREEVLKNGNLKIQWAKQNKHLVTHMNQWDTRSILTHPNPQKLVNEYAGTGQRITKKLPGTPDYRERINFGGKIGIWRSEDGTITKETTMGMIIYAKDGVHIVPLRPLE